MSTDIVSYRLSDSARTINIPNLDEYLILRCDFHMHTIYSDGKVSPAIRVEEAFFEGLDAIAFTDHIERKTRNKNYRSVSLNGVLEEAIASDYSDKIIVIKGAEISLSMPPGHFNAIFLTDPDRLFNVNYIDSFQEAKSQGAFIFWNHPGWETQQPHTTLWWPEHTELFDLGLMNGIEIANFNEYYPEAHQWALDKNLTIIGNSDAHLSIDNYTDIYHRTSTFVFAHERTAESIHEALNERRTAVYFQNYIIGEEIYLKEIFEKSVSINIVKKRTEITITFINNSDLAFQLKKDEHDPRISYLRNRTPLPYTISPQSRQSFKVRIEESITGGDVNFIIENLLIAPNTGMKYTIKI